MSEQTLGKLRVALVKHSLDYSMCLLAVSGFVKKASIYEV